MKTKVRTLSVCLTKEDNRQLEYLCEHFGEARSKVALRAINYLYYLQCELKTKPDVT